MVLLRLIAAAPAGAAEISVQDSRIVLRSESFQRILEVRDGSVRTTSLTVDGHEILAEPGREFSVVISHERSNRRPRGLRPDEAGEKNYFTGGARERWRSEAFDPGRYDDPRPDAPQWIEPKSVDAASWGALAGRPEIRVSKPAAGATRVSVRAALDRDPLLSGVACEMNFEVYDGYPVVRKWVVIRNGGTRWLKLDRLTVEDLRLTTLATESLAAGMFGVQPSILAFQGRGSGYGVVAVSEIPSALRFISNQGAMGYTDGLFEWVLGPGEEFHSEPVFYFAYSGPVRETASARSTPLDRAVEGPYMEFLRRHIGVAADKAPMHGPQWMTWAYFYDRIDDPLVRQLAGIASRAGFTEMLFDDGWQKGRLGTAVNTEKFPDFARTAEFVRSQGLALGLWVSCFRDPDSRDLAEMPDARVLPILLRSPSLPGLAMSFASPWREYYVKDLVALARRFGITYFKQDFTNVMYGDLAEGHESRTRRESLLRGLRGLLAAQEMLRREAPDVVNEITHEIYWGTPGVPADVAALKATARFHIPPNEAVGADIAREFRGRSITAEEHRAALLRGCWLARQRFYANRGLPLYPLEFYAAATTNHLGSLTPAVEDRQVASWLMGAPVCFSGDSRTLTEENIRHYRRRLEAVKRLEQSYGIYKRFQFSGVPEPTDIDWHWWGKLNPEGYGAVVVLRGSGGADRRMINIPWVRGNTAYRVEGLFSGKSYGTMSGQRLQDRGISVELPVYGQELLEVAPSHVGP